MKKTLKLRQAQLWKVGQEFIRIVRLERLEVEFMTLPSLESKKGTHHTVSKKEFCRLIKTGVLLSGSEPSDDLTD